MFLALSECLQPQISPYRHLDKLHRSTHNSRALRLGTEGVFVGSGIFKSSNPEVRAKVIAKATTHFQDPKIIAEVSKNLGEAMLGLDIKQISSEELLAPRGL